MGVFLVEFYGMNKGTVFGMMTGSGGGRVKGLGSEVGSGVRWREMVTVCVALFPTSSLAVSTRS